jgi:hypothetical protein
MIPLTLKIKHDSTLDGNGNEADPLTDEWAPEAETAYQLQDTAQKKSLSIDGDRIRLAGTLEDSTTINYSVPLTRNPFFDGVIHDTTLTGDGLSQTTALHSVTNVVHDTTLEGDGTQATPLKAVFTKVTHDTTLTGDGTVASPLKAVASGEGLDPVKGVPEFILNKDTIFDDGPTTDENWKFHISYAVDQNMKDYAKSFRDIPIPILKINLPSNYINSDRVPINSFTTSYTLHTNDSEELQHPKLIQDMNTKTWTVSYDVTTTDFTKIYVTCSNNLFVQYLSGFVTIEFVVPQPGLQTKNNEILKASKVIAENVLTLRRSETPYIYLAKLFTEYHSDNEGYDYFGVSYGLDQNSDEFKTLPLGTTVNYVDSNFGFEFTRQVSGTSINPQWSFSEVNNCPLEFNQRQAGWLETRYNDTTGNAFLGTPEGFGVTYESMYKQQYVDYVFLWMDKIVANRFMCEFIQDNGTTNGPDDNVWKFLYDHQILKVTLGEIHGISYYDHVIDGVTYWTMEAVGSTSKVEMSIVLNHSFRGMSNKWISDGTTFRLLVGHWDEKTETANHFMVPTQNIVHGVKYKYNYEFVDDDGTGETDLRMWVMKGYIYKHTNNDWDGTSNVFEYIENHGGYSISPKPEACTTLYTPYNIRARFIMGDNLESHIANINDISANVQELYLDVSNLNDEINKLEKQIVEMGQLVQILQADVSMLKVTMVIGGVLGFIGASTGIASMITSDGISLGVAGEEAALDIGAEAAHEFSSFSEVASEVSSSTGSSVQSADDLIIFDENQQPRALLGREGANFNNQSGSASNLDSEELRFYQPDNSTGGLSITSESMNIDIDGDNRALSMWCDRTNSLLNFSVGRSTFNTVAPPGDEDMSILQISFPWTPSVYDESQMFNKIVAVSNLDSIEFNRNNDSTGSGTVINRLCTSTDVANSSYTYSDNHVISSLGVKNLISQHSADIRYHDSKGDYGVECNSELVKISATGYLGVL